MSFYKKDLKKAFIEDNHLQERTENTCNSCMYYSDALGKRCHYLTRFFTDGICIPIKNEYGYGCDKYKYWREK